MKNKKEQKKTLNERQSPTTENKTATSVVKKTSETSKRLAAWEQVEQERERCRELERKVEELTKKIDVERRQTMSIEKQMRDEIRRLNRELRQEREESKKKNHCRLLITTTRRLEPLLGKHG